MKRWWVSVTRVSTYEIEAETKDEARDVVFSFKCPEPTDEQTVDDVVEEARAEVLRPGTP